MTELQMDYCDHDRAAFYRRLERNGPQAVADFRAAFG